VVPHFDEDGGFAEWWRRWVGSIAFALLIALGIVGFTKLENTDDEIAAAVKATNDNLAAIEAERASRVEAVTSVIQLFCNTNNEQDTILAGLINVSLAASEGRDLTPQQEEGLAVFQAAADDLRKGLPCATIVERYLDGKPIPTKAE
jgi:hypothetical protein